MSTISEDLLQELLLFLPSTDLLRLRCVSKSWRDLIDSPNFFQLHLNKSLKNMNFREVLAVADCIHPDYDTKFQFYAISFDSEFRFAVTREIDPPVQNIAGLVCIGSCRSLICLKITVLDDDNHKIVLWNPSTHSHRVLPFSPVGIEGRYYDFRYAFGYDEVADDYKVVRLTFNPLKYKNDYEAKVYSLKLDSWKEIDKVPLVFLDMSRPIRANGVIIWVFRIWGATASAFSLLILPLRTQVLHFVSFRDDLYKLDFEFKHCSSCPYQISSCDCDCQYHTLFKLINNKKSNTWTNFFLPYSNVNEGMDFLNNSFHEKLCSELRSFEEKIHSKTIDIYSDCTCCWVDSLVRVERSNGNPLVKTEAKKKIIRGRGNFSSKKYFPF